MYSLFLLHKSFNIERNKVMEELLFYIIDKKYIKYLSRFEDHISYNKDEIGHSRPYLGIVLKIENYNYFVLKQNDLSGVIGRDGNKIIEAEYEDVKIPNPEKAVFVCYEESTTKILNEKNLFRSDGGMPAAATVTRHSISPRL